jgi:hypothetical protein
MRPRASLPEETTDMPRFRAAIVCFATLATLLTAPLPLAADDDRSMIILTKVQMTYATLGSYADYGTIRIDAVVGEDTSSQTINFVTAFDAPDRLRYDQWYRTPAGDKHETVLWLEEGEPRIWRTQNVYSDEPDVTEMESRDDAFLEAGRGSGGDENPIPRFLLARGGSSLIFNMENIRTEGELEYDGVDCWYLSGKFKNTSRLRMVVGKDDYLIRRIEFIVRPEDHVFSRKLGDEVQKGVLRGGRLQKGIIKTTIEFHPRTDQYFLESDLIFDPGAERDDETNVAMAPAAE